MRLNLAGRLTQLIAMALVLSFAAPASAAPSGYLAATVHFGGSGSTPADEPGIQLPFFADQVRRVNPWFTAVSQGRYAEQTTSAFGPITIYPTEQLCSQKWRNEIRLLSDAAIRAQGFEPDHYKAVLYVHPQEPCDYGGFQNDVNRVVLNNRFELNDLIHELGHTLGLLHAGAQFCRTASGQRVTLPDVLNGSCTRVEYGDPYSVMGISDFPKTFASSQLEQLGWNAGRVERLTTTTPTVTKFLTPIEEDLVGSTEALRVTDGGVTLWLEYRTPTGVDEPPVWASSLGGLLVRLEASPLNAFILDMSPEDDDDQRAIQPGFPHFPHPQMSVGQTWQNPSGNLSFTLNSTTPFGASVTITQRTRPVPDLRGLRSAAARDAITAAGFAVGSTTGVFDTLCESVGRVISQDPVQGTRLLPGRVVNFTFGVPPARGCPGTQQ